jgi:hypothetical protein
LSVDTDNFSVRWTRSINFAAGTYRFTASSDDGMRVWVDNNQIIDVWYDSSAHTVESDLYLTSGDHIVRVEYYEAGGQAVAQFDWDLVSNFDSGWYGEYYNNAFLAGPPAFARNDAQIDFYWDAAPAAAHAGPPAELRRSHRAPPPQKGVEPEVIGAQPR